MYFKQEKSILIHLVRNSSEAVKPKSPTDWGGFGAIGFCLALWIVIILLVLRAI